MEVAEENRFFYRTHGCALCQNLADLRAPCCCLDAELIEVTEARLLKRCNLKKGDRLCSVHFDKVKYGLIFGLEKSECCAPFHVGGSGANQLRSVPRTWRHLFYTSSIRERYSPSLQICNRCYRITFDLLLRGERNSGASSTWDLSPLSPSSTLSAGSYTSPRRWLSSLALHANGSSTSGSSLSSSNTRLSSGSSSYLLSLYETHRENLGNPKTISDSIRRYFKYKSNAPHLSPQSPHTASRMQNYDSESAHASEKSLSDTEDSFFEKLVPVKASALKNRIQTFSPKMPLTCPESPNTFLTRQACKLILAKSDANEAPTDKAVSKTIHSDASFEIPPEPESIGLSSSNDFDQDCNEFCNSALADSLQDDEGLRTPRRVSSDSSLSSLSSNEQKQNAIPKRMSIDIQFVVNPLLKRSHLTSQAEMCKSFDSFSTNTDELIARAQNFDQLQVLSDSSSQNSEFFEPSSNVSSINTDEILSEKSFEHSHVEPIESCITELVKQTEEKLQNPDTLAFQIHNEQELFKIRLAHSSHNFLSVFAGTMAQCIVNFAIVDAYQKLLKDKLLEEKTSVKNKSEINSDFICCNESALHRDQNFVSIVKNSLDSQPERILTDVLNNVLSKERDCKLKQKSEIFFPTSTTQYLTLGLSSNNKDTNAPNHSVSSSSKTVIRWLEKKGCYRTVFSVQFKDKDSEIRNPYDVSSSNQLENLRADLDESMTLDFNPLNFCLVECVVDDLIPITRSLSTGFIDRYDDSLKSERSPRIRASSFDSFFTLTCKPTSSNENLDKQFIAVPVVDRLKSPGGESGVFLSTSTVGHFLSEDDEATINNKNDQSDALAAVESISISSGTTDFSSSSTSDDCDIIQAELLEKSKISERPHFVSHKSRIDEINESVPRNMSVPFQLKPELTVFPEEEEDSDNKSLESFGATVDLESQYEDASSTTVAEAKLNGSPENSVVKTTKDSTKNETTNGQEATRKRKISIFKKPGSNTFDWYVGEDLVEQRRSKQLLKVLSDASLFTNPIQKRRDVRVRKTDEEAEDEDVSDIISQALDIYTPRIFLRKHREDRDGSNHKSFKMVLRFVAVVGLIGSLVYVGWKHYS